MKKKLMSGNLINAVLDFVNYLSKNKKKMKKRMDTGDSVLKRLRTQLSIDQIRLKILNYKNQE